MARQSAGEMVVRGCAQLSSRLTTITEIFRSPRYSMAQAH